MNLIFLDIDMTIWDETLRIPESTKDAIRLARVMGNKVFINTGRSRSNTMYRALDELGMDGVVAACGDWRRDPLSETSDLGSGADFS